MLPSKLHITAGLRVDSFGKGLQVYLATSAFDAFNATVSDSSVSFPAGVQPTGRNRNVISGHLQWKWREFVEGYLKQSRKNHVPRAAGTHTSLYRTNSISKKSEANIYNSHVS